MSKTDLVAGAAKAIADAAHNLTDKTFDVIGIFIPPEKLIQYAKTKAEIKKIESNTNLTIERQSIAQDEENIKAIFAQCLVDDPEFKQSAQTAFLNVIREQMSSDRNLARVFAKSLEKINHPENIKNIDSDLFTEFSTSAKKISDEHMQQIWADVLAEEVNEPNSFSKKTLSILSCMTKNDAANFEKIASLCLIMAQKPVFFSYVFDLVRKTNPSTEFMYDLEEIGLIKWDYSGYQKTIHPGPMNIVFDYFDEMLICKIPENRTIKCGFISLTRSGEEIFKICNKTKNEKLISTLQDNKLFSSQFAKIEAHRRKDPDLNDPMWKYAFEHE